MKGLRFPRAETTRRIESLRRSMEERGLDVIVVFSSPGSMRYGQRGHVLYISGYEPYFGDSMVIVPVEKDLDPILQTDSADHFPSECTWIDGIVPYRDPVKTISEYLREGRMGKGTIGIAGEYSIPPRLLERIRKVSRNSELHLASDLLENARSVKSEYEVSCIRKALSIAKKGIEAAASFAGPGISETMVTGEVERACRLAGSEGFPHHTMVSSGTDLKHLEWWWHCAQRRLRKNDPWNIDIGTMYGSYCCDVARSLCLGRPSERHLESYSHLVEAFEVAMECARPGVMASEVNRAASEVMDKHFKSDSSGIGHGVGLEVHEWPFVGYEYILNDPVYEDTVLRENMVISVEPQIYTKEFGYLQVEDDFVVTRSGGRRLSRIPLSVIESG